jgi:hypothetical protein
MFVPCETVEKGQQHAPPASNRNSILLCLYRLTAESLMGGSLRQSLTSEIAEIGVAVTSSASVACGYVVGDVGAGEVYGRL